MNLEETTRLVKGINEEGTWLEFRPSLMVGFGVLETAITYALAGAGQRAIIETYGEKIKAAHLEVLEERKLKKSFEKQLFKKT